MLTWLLDREEYRAAGEMARSVARQLTDIDLQTADRMANAFFFTRNYAESVPWAIRALSFQPDSPDLKFNAALCTAFAGDPRLAVQLISEVLQARPQWEPAVNNYALYLDLIGQHDQAFQVFTDLRARLPESNPNHDISGYNLGLLEIRRGQIRKGFQSFTLGRKFGLYGASREFPHKPPRLKSSDDIQGKTVLICGEGGAGDEIITARYGAVLDSRGASAAWISRTGLASVLGRVKGISRTIDIKDLASASYDYWLPCMDAAAILDLDLPDIHGHPYITALPEYVRKWSERIGETKKMKIGLRWAGNPTYDLNALRKIPFNALSKITSAHEAVYVSLQRDDGYEELPGDGRVLDAGAKLTDWEETCGLIANLDLVITSCTSIAHLAGAMGVPTWVICPVRPFYTWAIPGPYTPWYDTVRLFRQTKVNSWSEPVDEVIAALKEMP